MCFFATDARDDMTDACKARGFIHVDVTYGYRARTTVRLVVAKLWCKATITLGRASPLVSLLFPFFNGQALRYYPPLRSNDNVHLKPCRTCIHWLPTEHQRAPKVS
jgi:hypothetical protein